MALPNDSSAAIRLALSAISALLLCPGGGLAQQASVSKPALQAEAALRAGDFERAADLFQQRAKAGDVEAQYRLASLLRSGRGVAQNDVLAFQWMKSAAENGYAKAELNLGKMY